MKSKIALRMLLGGLLFGAASCGVLTEPKPLVDEFTWEAVENPNDIVEGVDIAAFFSDISFLGQMKTPTLCYTITSKLETSGNTLTLRVDAASTNAPSCAQTQGGFRYNGIIRNLAPGTYTVRVIHAIPGQAQQEFTKTVKL